MKEAFWGVLIVMLGLFGIVVVNLFQKVTIENDRVYYVIKETTEASMYDAVDLSTYRLTGKLRMVEDKFVENLTRRFAQNVSLGNYTITVQDINETPPYVSVVVKSSVSSIKGDAFTISNSVNGILETKYTLDELLDFLGITEDEWNSIQKGEDKNVCDMSNFGESECIPGDLKFGGFEDVSVPATNCIVDAVKENVPATATYYECECGKWKEYKEDVYASGVKNSKDITYKWTFAKEGKLRNLNETMTRKTKLDVCTTGVQVMVPSYLVDKNMSLPVDLEEPSKNNSAYSICPAEGIRIPSEQVIVLHGGYIPDNATNRVLKWTKDGNAFTMSSANSYVSKSSYSRAIVTAKKVEKGETASNIATATTTLNQTGTCKVNIWDGSVDSIKCENMSLYLNNSGVIKYSFEPRNANKTSFTFTSSDTNIATISGNTITAKSTGTVNITMTDTYTGKKTTCSFNSSVYTPASGGVPYVSAQYVVKDNAGNILYSGYSYDVAKTTLVNNANKYDSNSGETGAYLYVEGSQTAKESAVKIGNQLTVNQFYGFNGSLSNSSTEIAASPKPPATNVSAGNVGFTGLNGVTITASPRPTTTIPYTPPSGNGWVSTGGGRVSSAPAPVPAPVSSSSCLVSGTKISLANGKTKSIEDINYNDLLLVWNYETGTYAYEYPIWLEQSSESESYLLSTFSDGTTLRTVGDHSVFNTDLSEFVKVTDSNKYYVGATILKKDNNKLKKVKIEKIETINKKVRHYYIISTRYFNIFADNVLTVDGLTEISNQYGFDDNYKWILYDDVVKNNNNLYSHDKFKNIPYYLFSGLRLAEGKYLVNMNYLSESELKYYIDNNIGNSNLTINPNTDLNGNRLWKVTTSNNINDTKVYKEGSKYILPKVTNLYTNNKKINNNFYLKKEFIGWYNMSDGKIYDAGDKVTINHGMHFEAIWR